MKTPQSFVLACNVKRLLTKIISNLDFLLSIRLALLRRLRRCLIDSINDVEKKQAIEKLLIHYHCVFTSQLIVALFYRKFEAHLLHEDFLNIRWKVYLNKLVLMSSRFLESREIHSLFLDDLENLKKCDIENLISLKGKFGNYHVTVNALAGLPAECSKVVYDIQRKKKFKRKIKKN